jgi:glycine cleavage system H protein
MPSPDDRRYLETHEWHKPEGDLVVCGISQFAVDELTDITYVEVTDPDGEVEPGAAYGEIESVKATSELYCGVPGRIVEVNQRVIENPAIINEDCYGRGWIIKVRPDDPAALGALMPADEYDKQHSA